MSQGSGTGGAERNPVKMSAPSIPHIYGAQPLRFERLLSDLSTSFTALPASQLDQTIKATQRSLCQALGLEHSELAQWDETTKQFNVAHSTVLDHFLVGRTLAQQDIPWMSANILHGDIIHFTRKSKLCDEAATDVERIFHTTIQAAIFFPLTVGKQVFGFLGFGTSSAAAECSLPFNDRLRVLADAIGKALAFNRSSTPAARQERRRVQADERFRMLLASFPTAAVIADEEGRIVLVNAQISQMFSYREEELVGNPLEMLFAQRFRKGSGEDRMIFTAPAISSQMGTEQELYAIRKDGFEFQIKIALSPIQICRGGLILATITDITDRKSSEKNIIDIGVQLLEANEQIRKMKEQLECENIYLKQEINLDAKHVEVIGQGKAILQVLTSVEQVAATDAAVLLLGETGTGKELIARAIHKSSKRKARPMVNVNCAALPASLVESELFGRERGAFTGALTREVGRFELADRSTIFLDEIGELPLELQSKLLRVLQEGEFERLGSSKTIRVDVRLIAATSRDLEEAVREARFREDLYYRLNVFPIRVPPLRERRDDIPMLVWHFLRELGNRMGRDIEAVRTTTMKEFQSYSWPGNVRELRNVIERNLIIHPGKVFEAELPLRRAIAACPSLATTIEDVERNHICHMLDCTGWRIRGVGGAADVLGLRPTTLEARMKKLGIFRKSRG
jgi:formate hydrogenlyase transcriptional activator